MKFSTLLMTGLLSTTVVGCSNNSTPTNNETKTDDTSSVAENKELEDDSNALNYKVATVFTYPPFAMSNEQGKSDGFDIDIINAIAEKQDFSVTYMPMKWENWQKDLTDNNVDVWAAGIALKEERKEIVDFTDSYLDYHTVAMILDNEETTSIDINNMNQLKLSAQANTTDFKIASELVAANTEVLALKSDFIGLENLIQKKVDAVIGNDAVLSYHANAYPEIKTRLINIDSLENNKKQKQLSFMVKKGNTELSESINQGLKKIKEDGTYNEIHKKWFGQL